MCDRSILELLHSEFRPSESSLDLERELKVNLILFLNGSWWGNCVIKWSNEVHYSVFIIAKQSSVCLTQGSNPPCCSRSIISAAQELPDLLPSELEPCLPHEYWFSKMSQYFGSLRRLKQQSGCTVYLAGKRPRATSWVWNVLAKSQPPQFYHMGPDRTGVTSISTLIPTQILRGREEDAGTHRRQPLKQHQLHPRDTTANSHTTQQHIYVQMQKLHKGSWITADRQFAAWF